LKEAAICNHLIVSDLCGRGQAKQADETGKAAATCNLLFIKDLGGVDTHKTTKQACRSSVTT